MGKLLGFLIIAGGIAGLFFVYQDYAAKEKANRNTWEKTMALGLRLHTAASVRAAGEDGTVAGEGSFLRILYQAHRAEQDGYSVLDTVKKAAVAAGATSAEAAYIANSVVENLRVAREMGALSDPSNVLNMERGEPPVAKAKGWEDEKLVMGHRISPLLVPEAAYAIPNLVLVPESVRDMQDDTVTPATVDLVRKWLVEKMVGPDSAQLVIDKSKENLPGVRK